MTVADALKRFRSQYKVSQSEVAQKLGMLPQAYSRYETGKYSPRADDVVKLAQAYNVSADYLLGLSEIASPNDAVKTLGRMIKFHGAIKKALDDVDKN